MTEETYHHGDLRAAVLACATQMLVTHGVEKLSLRRIARELGVSHQAPYKHFADREAVVTALRTDGFRALTESTEAAAKKHPRSQRRQLEAAAAAYVKNALASPALYQLMFAGPSVLSDDECAAAAKASFDALVSIVDGQQECEPSKQSVARARLFWASMHGVVSLAINQYFGDTTTEPAKMAKQLCRDLATQWDE